MSFALVDVARHAIGQVIGQADFEFRSNNGALPDFERAALADTRRNLPTHTNRVRSTP